MALNISSKLKNDLLEEMNEQNHATWAFKASQVRAILHQTRPAYRTLTASALYENLLSGLPNRIVVCAQSWDRIDDLLRVGSVSVVGLSSEMLLWEVTLRPFFITALAMQSLAFKKRRCCLVIRYPKEPDRDLGFPQIQLGEMVTWCANFPLAYLIIFVDEVDQLNNNILSRSDVVKLVHPDAIGVDSPGQPE